MPNSDTGEIVRNPAGQFVSGYAPKTKSPGAPRGPRASDQIRTLIEPHREALIARAVELALAGDPQALKLCLERLAPIPRQEAEKIIIPDLASAPTFSAKCEAVVGAIAGGHIAPEDGERILRMLDTYRRAHAVDNLERRVAQLEGGGRLIEVRPEGDDDAGASLV